MKRLVIVAGAFLVILVSGSAKAATLDLGALASFDYAGQDSSGAQCRLLVGAIRQDFGGRIVQDYRIWVEGRGDLNFNLLLRGPSRVRDGQDVGGGQSEFKLSMDGLDLALVGANDNTANLSSYRLMDTTGASGRPTTLIDCKNIRATRR